MTDLLDYGALRYPATPGHRGVDTSVAAAEAIAPITARLQRKALSAISAAGPAGLTCHELAETLGVERASVQPRTTELRLLGKVRDSGLRRPNPSGIRAIAWVACHA